MPDDRFIHPRRWFVAGGVPPGTSWPCGRRRWTLPRVAGVYAVYVSDAVVYIGSAANLRQRIANHISRGHWSDERPQFKLALTPPERRQVRERRLVERLRPRDNRQWLWDRKKSYREGYW